MRWEDVRFWCESRCLGVVMTAFAIAVLIMLVFFVSVDVVNSLNRIAKALEVIADRERNR